jgi:hypothetical protein
MKLVLTILASVSALALGFGGMPMETPEGAVLCQATAEYPFDRNEAERYCSSGTAIDDGCFCDCTGVATEGVSHETGDDGNWNNCGSSLCACADGEACCIAEWGFYELW